MQVLPLWLTCVLTCAAQPGTAPVTLNYLHSFSAEGGAPSGPLTEVWPGVFAGVTFGEINPSDGTSLFPSTLYLVNSTGFKVVHTFNPPVDGQGAYGPLLAASDGALYGVSFGCNNVPTTIFRFDHKGNFDIMRTGLVSPSPLSEGLDLNLYGLSGNVGSPIQFFRLSPSGQYTPISALPGAGYLAIVEAPLLANDGHFYIPATGLNSVGTIYRSSISGAVTPVVTLANLSTGLMQAGNGGLYGWASTSAPLPYVFRLSLNGSYTPIYSFPSFELLSDLMQASDGKLYGIGVGIDGVAMVFSINPDGSSFQVVANFNEGFLLGPPMAPLRQGSDGKLYGVNVGGPGSIGNVFSLDLGLPRPHPSIALVQPGKISVGSGVLLTGRYLLEPQSVEFNGAPATVIRGISAGYVYAVVPPGASSGPITIKTPNGTATSSQSLIVQ